MSTITIRPRVIPISPHGLQGFMACYFGGAPWRWTPLMTCVRCHLSSTWAGAERSPSWSVWPCNSAVFSYPRRRPRSAQEALQ